MHTPLSLGLQKFVCKGLLLVFLATALFPAQPTAEALTILRDSEVQEEALRPGGGLESIRSVESLEERYGLVAILVEADLYEDGKNFDGLGGGLLGAGTDIATRVQRYAEDIQDSLPWTKTLIIKVEPEDSTLEIQKLLEKLYFEGDEGDNDPTKLSGLAIVGDVPLPVVNKGGHRFISMLPYTDFEEPSYILEETSQDFIRNEKATELQAEIWHGLLVPPLRGDAGTELLAEFFDKNHDYHEGVAEAVTFDKRVFIGDLVTERDTLNEISFGSYEMFMKYWEDIAYYRYTNDMVEEIYNSMATEVEEGDLLDNDGDDHYDEEALDGQDDDNDGLIDEDLGNGFFGIDNDEDGEVDEDSPMDNNNDIEYRLYDDSSLPFYEDHMMDEDPPGDANGDGCPGRCNFDDNGNSVDHDDDGYPTGWELANDYEWNDQRKPHRDVVNKTGMTTAQLKELYVDEDYRDIIAYHYGHESCFDENTVYHKEWDDDEDGFCDEDGTTEPSQNDPSCSYNDNDCDGTIDEDPMGYEPEGLFEELPDIQSKSVVEELVSRYVDLFEQPQGVWNRLVGATGRYATQGVQDETVISDYDSAASLIAKKDEFTLQYLRSVNDYFEARVNTMVEPLSQEIPLVIAMEITGTVTYEPELDEDGNEKEPKVDDMCKEDSNNDDKACLQFVNHSTSETGTETADNLSPSNSFLYGSMMNSIDEAGRCSSFGGTFEDGQFIKYSALYSKTAQELQAEYYKSKSDEQKYKGCLLKNKIFETEDPDEEICFSVLAEYPVRSEDGAILFEDTERYDITGFEVGAAACYEYRYLDTFQIYSKVNGSFSDWLTKSLRKDDEEFEEYEDVVAAIEAEKDEIADANDGNRPGEVTLRAGFDTLTVFRDDGEDINYTLQQFFDDLGLSSYSYDDLDVYMTMHSSATVSNPSGANMGDIDTIQVFFNKYYIKDDDPGNRTEDLSEARQIPSLYYHTEPDYDTLNRQIEDAAVPDLPIDETRRVSFFDSSDDYQEVEYLNVFDAEDTGDVTTQIKNLLTDMNGVHGSEIYDEEITDFLSEINEDQLEDALDWYRKNIDEKHDYVFTHYLGLEEPVVAKAREGYEIFSVIAHGNADELHYGFNAAAPEIEEDLIFNYRTEDAAEEAEFDSENYEPIGDEVSLVPVSLVEWMSEMEEWLGDVQDSVSSFDLTPEDLACSADSFLSEADPSDYDENGVPDLSDATVTLELTSEDNPVLQAGGKDIYIVTASARKSNGVVNTDDDFTEVEIEFVSGAESVEISGPARLQLTDGVATFVLESAEVGDFQIEAAAFNRSDLNDSNSLSGIVSDKYVKVSSYITESGADSDELSVQGSSIEIYDDAGNIAAVFNPVTGSLDVRIGEALIYEATATVPTRAAIVPEGGGEAYGSIYIIPEVKTVSIGDGLEGVFVEEVGAVASAEKIDDYVELYVNDVNMGIVSPQGQINVGEGYRLEFENPGVINLYDPIQILDADGETVFTVNVKQEFDSADLLDPVGVYAPYIQISFKWLKGRFASLFPRAEAASSIPDSDGDLLDDLEEVTIGTDKDAEDTDGDGFKDGSEIFSGYSALSGNGAPLFTDMNAGHPAYHDVAVLYLRGVLRGYTDGSFRPDNNMIREEFVQVDLGAICIACQLFSEDYKTEVMGLYSIDPFPDPDINPELLYCVADAKNREIVSGYEGGMEVGLFVPKRYISRAEATKVLVETGGIASRVPGADEAWYQGYVEAATANGLFPDGAVVNTAYLEGYITRSEFAQMAVNLVEANDCRDLDTDGDGLSDAEEDVIYGTDKTLPDTDFGGVNDLDEVLRDSDPLDASDDFPTTPEPVENIPVEDFTDILDFDHEPGVYSVADEQDYESITSSLGEGSTEIKVFTDDVLADGNSTLTVKAEIRDQEGNIYFDDNSSVVEFTLSTADHALLLSERVQVQDGLAETTLTSKEVAGEVFVEAVITDGSLPSQGSTINVHAGQAVSVELTGDSTVLPAGGESITEMQAILYDSFGNVANYGFQTLTLSSEGGIELLDLRDEDMATEGIQISTADGFVNFRVLASLIPETSVVMASISTPVLNEDSYSIQSIEGMQIALESSSARLFAGGSGSDEVAISVVDEMGQVLTGFQGDVLVTLSDPSYGTLSSNTISLTLGTGAVEFTPLTLAGDATVMGDSAGLTGGSVTLDIDPADPYELRIRSEEGGTVMEANSDMDLIVESFDVYGNFVDNDSSTVVDLRLTPSTEAFGSLGETQVTLEQGQAEFEIESNNNSGKLNVVGMSGDLLAGTWSGDLQYKLTGEDFEDIEPQMLYGSVLGGPFGDVTQTDYVAGWMTFNGKTQAVTSLLAEPHPKARLATVDAMGAIDVPSSSFTMQSVLPAGSELPVRIQWRNFLDDLLQAEIFYKVPATGAAIAVTQVSARSDIVLEEKDGGVLLRENEAGAVDIREDGQIEILDPNYSLAVNANSPALSLLILRGTDVAAEVNFEGFFDDDVELLEADFNLEDWDNMEAGIYVKPSVQDSQNFVPVPSGNSSANAMGLALTNPLEDLPEEQQPSMGYSSVERADIDGTVGWENENKHLLLFAAGNTAGASNVFYSSEIGVLLGDPTIKLTTPNDVNDLGYTSDVGSLVYASQDEILNLVDIDYNGDGMRDILTAYEDGRIDVLQNYDSAARLSSRGTLLQIENGISSIDAGNFTDDDLEDLLIVTEEACLEGENCIYLYENIGGGFVAQYLDLEGLDMLPKQIEVGDLNNDDLDDFVLFDENMSLFVAWNRNGEFSDVEKIEDFGLETDSNLNLYHEVLLRDSALTEGSANLAIITEEFQTPQNVTTDLQDLLDGLVGDPDFTVEIDDVNSEGETIEVKDNQIFEYANLPTITENYEVTKSVNDVNGGLMDVGDEVMTTLVIKNDSSSQKREIYVSDELGDYFRADDESYLCSGCTGANASAEFKPANSLGKPFVFGPLTLSAGASVTLTYKSEVTQLPKLSVMLGHDFYTDYKNDNLLDIAVSPEDNSGGILMVYTSDELVAESNRFNFIGTNFEKVSYVKKEYSPEDPEYEDEYDTTIEDPFADESGDGIPDLFEVEKDGELVPFDAEEGIPVPPVGQVDFLKTVLGASDKNANGFYSTDEMFKDTSDMDDDGLNDTVDSWIAGDTPEDYLVEAGVSFEDGNLEVDLEVLDDAVSGITEKIEQIVTSFTCNGGCIAFPSSIAFLTPGSFHDPFTGLPTGFDPGTPVFGLLPYPIPVVCAGAACYASQVMRIYISPTTTLGLGVAICLGPYGPGQCYAFNVPLLQALGFCDAINGFLADIASKATSFEASADAKIFNVNVDASAGDVNGFSSSIFDNYSPPLAVNTNIQVPGFPSIFTEWWKKQKIEFFQMLDLPDITFIYPDPQNLTSEPKPIELEENFVTKNITGLETFVNYAHSVPLVDIETEKVYFHYPALTDEEIERIKKDLDDWIQDTKDLRLQVEQYYENIIEEFPELRADLEEARDEVLTAIDQLIEGMENNLAVLEDYAEIPEEIVAIRDLQAYYAKVVICYLDAILGFTAGYLLENKSRIEAWAQWVQDLKDIVASWQALIDISIKMMDSCDKCTNQRYSGFQLLANLFVFIPEPPIIEMPKWPDIVIDVSNIQAGVDVVWPDLVFVPETISIPDIPRIVLPPFDVDAALNFDLGDFVIPVLPEFNLDFVLPELPGLPLPTLPDLPPPPAIPELDGTLSATLNIVSSIIRVICTIRQGFIPVPEMMLKSKIEEMTERPGFILPIDLDITVDFPPIGFDFLERIELSTYLRVTPELSVLYDLIDALADESSEFVEDLTSTFNDALQQAASDVQDSTDISEYGGEYEVEVDVEVPTSFQNEANPAADVANAYKDHPLVSGKLLGLSTALEQLSEQSAEWNASVPEVYELEATQRLLSLDDPLLNRYDEVIKTQDDLDQDFLASIQGTPLASMTQVKDSMIAYVENLENGTERLEMMEDTDFYRYLAQEQGGEQRYHLAADEEDSLTSSDDFNPEEAGRDPIDAPVILSETTSIGLEPVSTDNGMYIVGDAVAERLTDYTAESSRQTHLLFVDIDDDNDDDIVYSLHGDVYIKENFDKSPDLDFVSAGPRVETLADLTPDYGNVKNLKRGENNHEESSFAFDAAGGAEGYEVLLYDSLDAQEAEPDENVKRLLLLQAVENESTTVELSSEDGFISPSTRPSRLMADSVSGTVKLFNARQRTEIESDGEISSGDELSFQTLEETTFKIKLESEEVSIQVPAHTLAVFPRQENRTVRVENGRAYWLEDDLVTEQDLEANMEVMAGEQVILQSSGADVTLSLNDDVSFELDKQELFLMDRLMNTENPSAQIELENGAYYSVMHPVFESNIGTLSDNVLLNPQICADDSAPYPIVSDTELDLAIFATTTLSAENSFDSDSEIVDVYWDLDNTVDVDGDGIANNDEELIGETALIGPYDTVSTKYVTLWITDTAGNTSTATITVNIVVPQIIVSEAHPDLVSGSIQNPDSPNFPFHLVRDREGAVTEIGSGYVTDENSNFDITDLELSDLLNVTNEAGELIAQFNPTTKQLLVYDVRYEALALPADAAWPARLTVSEISTGLILGSFIIVSDGTEGVDISQSPLDKVDLSGEEGVVVYEVDDEEHYQSIPDGFAAVDDEGIVDVKIAKDGNISILDPRFTLVKREAETLEEYLVIELYDGETLELEIYPGSSNNVTLTSTEELGLPSSQPVEPHEDISGDFQLYFEDIDEDDPLVDDIADLVERGVLEGYTIDGEQYFLPDQPITRAEFTKIILGILCIIPGADSFVLPYVLSDVLDPALWYFPYTKEAFVRDIVTGYLGEINAEGLSPFKPNNTINRAEAAKIMLEALDTEGIIELPADLFGEPWYTPYMEIAQDLTPYLVNESAGMENFILTADEAADPAHIVTRYEFVEMSVRALEAYNCFELDSDNDGLFNFDEENTYGTDPYNPDTDFGGVNDGEEVARGSDPLDPSDDFPPEVDLGLETGIYAVEEPCISCPCVANIDFAADLRPGDVVFAIIQNEEGTIFAESNKVTVTD